MESHVELHLNECSAMQFLAIYSKNKIKAPYTSKNIYENHNLFESVRRFLDITRAIHKRWEYVSTYILATSDENQLTDIFENFHIKASPYQSINIAACELFYENIKNANKTLFIELLNYEDYVNNYPRKRNVYEKSCSSNDCILVPYDLESMYLSIMFYSRAAAPSFLYKSIQVEPGVIYKKEVIR